MRAVENGVLMYVTLGKSKASGAGCGSTFVTPAWAETARAIGEAENNTSSLVNR